MTLGVVVAMFIIGSVSARSIFSSSFNYLGYLENSGEPITGSCDFDFSLYAVHRGGSPLADMSPITNGSPLFSK